MYCMDSKTPIGRSENKGILFLFLPAGSFRGECLGHIRVRMCESKAYSRTKRQLISAQREISCSVLIRVSWKFEISPAQRKQTEKHRAGSTFFLTPLQNYSMSVEGGVLRSTQ